MRKWSNEKRFASSLGIACRHSQPSARAESRIGKEIDVLDVRYERVENLRRRFGAGEFADNDIADEVAQRREAAVDPDRHEIVLLRQGPVQA